MLVQRNMLTDEASETINATYINPTLIRQLLYVALWTGEVKHFFCANFQIRSRIAIVTTECAFRFIPMAKKKVE